MGSSNKTFNCGKYLLSPIDSFRIGMFDDMMRAIAEIDIELQYVSKVHEMQERKSAYSKSKFNKFDMMNMLRKIEYSIEDQMDVDDDQFDPTYN